MPQWTVTIDAPAPPQGLTLTAQSRLSIAAASTISCSDGRVRAQIPAQADDGDKARAAAADQFADAARAAGIIFGPATVTAAPLDMAVAGDLPVLLRAAAAG